MQKIEDQDTNVQALDYMNVEGLRKHSKQKEKKKEVNTMIKILADNQRRRAFVYMNIPEK